MQNFHGKSKIQQEEASSQQKIGFEFKEEKKQLMYLGHSFVWC
jgi:hypothetical protein